MSQFLYVIDPPKLQSSHVNWAFENIGGHHNLVEALKAQNLTQDELKHFENSSILTFADHPLNDMDSEHHFLEEGKIIWTEKFPQIMHSILANGACVLCFFGSFERESSVFVNKQEALVMLEDQLASFPVELNIMYIPE